MFGPPFSRMQWRNVCLLLLAGLFAVYLYLWAHLQVDLTAQELEVHRTGTPEQQVTMRVNSFRRLDLLEFFLDYYKSCAVVSQIQVVWSDQQNAAPLEWSQRYPPGKVVFEVHDKNSLSNRFLALHAVPTEAVLSIDDDLVIPCPALQEALRVWQSFDQALVGFSPRMLGFNAITGSVRYLRWQHTWWSGLYAVMLTKAAFLHRDHFQAFASLVPAAFLAHVDQARNCEDIAMAYVVAKRSGAAPVWVDGVVYEVSEKGISSGQGHFADRGECVALLQRLTGDWPWVTGKQKVSRLNLFDALHLW